MAEWPSSRASVVLAALLRIGWRVTKLEGLDESATDGVWALLERATEGAGDAATTLRAQFADLLPMWRG